MIDRLFAQRADEEAKRAAEKKAEGTVITGAEGKDEFNRGVDANDTRDDRETYELNVSQNIHGRSAKYNEVITPEGTVDLTPNSAENKQREQEDQASLEQARNQAKQEASNRE